MSLEQRVSVETMSRFLYLDYSGNASDRRSLYSNMRDKRFLGTFQFNLVKVLVRSLHNPVIRCDAPLGVVSTPCVYRLLRYFRLSCCTSRVVAKAFTDLNLQHYLTTSQESPQLSTLHFLYVHCQCIFSVKTDSLNQTPNLCLAVVTSRISTPFTKGGTTVITWNIG